MLFFGCILAAMLMATLCTANVEKVTDENFGTLVNKPDEWLLEFHAPWCGHCKHFEPKYQAAERIVSSSSLKNVRFGQVDTDANPALAARFFISRLPTLVHIKDHQVRAVSKRDVNSLVALVEKEEWQEIEPVHWLKSPFSLFGSIIGFIGVTTKKMAGMNPWGLVGILGGFVVCFAVVLLRLPSTDGAVSEIKEKEDPVPIPASASVPTPTKGADSSTSTGRVTRSSRLRKATQPE